jgi:general secretion pathway protein I
VKRRRLKPNHAVAAVRCGRARGFTLVEILVALVIVAVGMAALMEALSSSARSLSYMRDETFSQWVALNQIANLRLQLSQGQVPPTGNTTGDIDYAGRSWHWRQEIVATQVTGMERIDVKVRPGEVKAGDDSGWFVTVSGIVGDAIASPGVTMLNWSSSMAGSGGQTGPNTGTFQSNPNQPGTTTGPGVPNTSTGSNGLNSGGTTTPGVPVPPPTVPPPQPQQ